MQLQRSTYEVLQILSISLIDKITYVLFDKSDFNDVKELDCHLSEGLFNYFFNLSIFIGP